MREEREKCQHIHEVHKSAIRLLHNPQGNLRKSDNILLKFVNEFQPKEMKENVRSRHVNLTAIDTTYSIASPRTLDNSKISNHKYPPSLGPVPIVQPQQWIQFIIWKFKTTVLTKF